MLNKKLAAFIAERKKHNTYWIERLKLDFALQLEKRRKTAGLSYADFAEKLGTSPAYVTKVFRGDANLTIESMVKLARAIGGKVDLRIVDEKAATDPRAWAGKLVTFPTAKPSLNSTKTAVSKVTLAAEDYMDEAA
ncbi:MAG: helix-turn-helix transcriptional regulator [Methylophilaceae bacterium]